MNDEKALILTLLLIGIITGFVLYILSYAKDIEQKYPYGPTFKQFLKRRLQEWLRGFTRKP
jgi:hypothetical protein